MQPYEHTLHRRSTDEVRERLSQKSNRLNSVNASWYTPGVDFCFYAPARNACEESRQRLLTSKLENEEQRLLQVPIQPDAIISKLRQIENEQQQKTSKRTSLSKNTSNFVNSFCAFADSISHIVSMVLPQSPEYTVTFGMLFVLFNAVVTKKEREESLLAYIHSISSRLPLMDFYKNAFPTDALKACVTRVYVLIMKLLDEAIVYYRSWRWSKLVDAMLQRPASFDDHIQTIDEEIRTMHELKEAAHIAQASDMMDVVKDTGLLMTRLHDSFTNKANAIGTSMEILNTKIDTFTSEAGYLLNFETHRHARSLQEVLLPGGRDAEEELNAIISFGFNLSPKDHWENNGVLESLMEWSQSDHDQLLWIGGASGNQDSWVTELSTDIVRALQPQLVTSLYVFCDHPYREKLTAMGLVRRLIVQLLDLHPRLAYQRPELCNTWRFQKAVMFGQLWHIFEELASRVPSLFIVIDRVEECQADEQADLVHQLLPSLIELANSFRGVGVLVTSTFDPPEEVSSLPFYKSYIDTSKKLDQR